MATLTDAEIQSGYAEALKAQEAGRLEEALGRYGRILAANPRLPEVHFQIGRIYAQAHRAPRALVHLATAARLKPAEPAIWRAWAEAVALAGDDAGERTFLDALRTAPLKPELRIALQDRFGANRSRSRAATGSVPAAGIQKLIALMTARRHAEAELLAEALLRQHGPVGTLANILASAQGFQGKTEAALANYARAHRIEPDNAEAWSNHGMLLLELRRNAEAAQAFRNAVALAPGKIDALAGLGLSLVRAGEAERALPYLERAVRIRPDHALSQLALGNCYTRLHEPEKALAALERAIALKAGNMAEAHALMGQALSRLGRDDEAMASYDRALALNPALPLAHGGKAALLQTLGRFDEAEPHFARAFALDPTNGENYRVYIASHKTRPGEAVLAEMVARFDDPGTSDTDRMNFGFAIAKAMEDIKEHDKVFRYLDAANGLMRKAFPYDIANRRAEIETVQRIFDGFDWHGALAGGLVPAPTGYAPIFVTGMPRSGTTLIEQILASHSTVAGAGEVGAGTRLATRLLAGPGGPRPMASLEGAEIAALGHDYEAALRARLPDALRVTDKSIQTYLHLGLLKLALPNARFIVVRRDPRDTLLSIYKNKFSDGTHLYAYDLKDLGHYYDGFVEMVEFWRARVPDWFHEVHYEALTADPEAETRRLVAAAGLDWEDACLNFHENTRKVETLSVFQVRQPISRASVAAWKRHEAELQPLIEVLREHGHVD